MQCDICGEEVDNSEALAQHKEKLHAIEDSEKPVKEESPEPSEEQENPDPAPIIPGRM